MSTTLDFDLKKAPPELFEHGRWDVLTQMIIHTNERNRCWPTVRRIGTRASKSLETVNEAKKWLKSVGAIVDVPFDQRIGKELDIPKRQCVYEVTGIIKIAEKEYPYLYLEKVDHGDIEDVTPSETNDVTPSRISEGVTKVYIRENTSNLERSIQDSSLSGVVPTPTDKNFPTPISGQGKVTVLEVDLNPPTPPVALPPSSQETGLVVPTTESEISEIVIGGTDPQPLVQSLEEFARQVPAGHIARYRITAWDSDGQFKQDYRMVHYNRGKSERMSVEALCGSHTGNDWHAFYSNEPLEQDYNGGATPFKLCPECALNAANPPVPAPKGTRWIEPIDGKIKHLVTDTNLPDRTLCGITPLPSCVTGGEYVNRQTQCQECLKAARDKPKRVRKAQPTDPLYEAIALNILGVTDAAGREAAGWRIGQIMNGDKRSGRCGGMIAYEQARQGNDDLDYATLARDVRDFWKWFITAHPGMELRDCAKVMERWAEWRSSVKPVIEVEMVPHPDDSTRRIKATDRDRILREKKMTEDYLGRKS